MGKGDKKTRKGKIAMGSYGVTRPKAKNKKAVEAPKAAAKKPAAKKAPAKKPAAKKAEK